MVGRRYVSRLIAIAFLGAISAGTGYACQCAGNNEGKNAWEVAKLNADKASVIFVGTPERIDIRWDLFNNKVGELISADSASSKSFRSWPGMLVTFRVQTSYKGNLGSEIQLNTGFGGGDCGAVYAHGLNYLIFASGSSAEGLGVSMCSPGGWVGNDGLETKLRYLNKERPTTADLAPFKRLSAKEYVAQEGKRRRDWEEFQHRYAELTGKICGTLSLETGRDENPGLISFLSTAGYSPFDHPTANINPDGSFCSNQLAPGKYYLYFGRASEAGLTSSSYFPGVSDQTKATQIEVSAGQIQSGITFKVPTQKTYAVRGIVSTNDKSGLNARNVSVSLVSTDGLPFPFIYTKPIDFQPSLPLPRVKYFSFENVLPGRYIAYVSVMGQGWYTVKQEVNVTTHMKFVSLELIHKN